jgi:single-stranded-DNA-specific exonuclease
MQRRWQLCAQQPAEASSLAKALGVHRVTAQLLLNRGVATAAEGRRFLDPCLEALSDPRRLEGLARGVERLQAAIARQEPILIFSDSDADGLTGGLILEETLRGLGASVRAKVSNRIADGYGMPDALVRAVGRSAVKLLVLVDCGTNQPEAIARLAGQGIETIVVDHHVPMDPPARLAPEPGRAPARPLALINPYAGDGPGRELCSAGLALKVAQALLGGAGSEAFAALLDLAVLGTLADLAPLVGDNRIIVRAGGRQLLRTARPGLRRLCEQTGVREGGVEQLTRRLIPRINASGRLGEASAIRSLLAAGEASPRLEEWLASAAEAHETVRRLHRDVLHAAFEQVNRLHFRDRYVLVVSGEGWAPGVLGPLASQLAERYGRPSIALSVSDRRAVGSARSVPAFNLLGTLQACQEHMVRFGGHAQACGLTLETHRLEAFREAVNESARTAVGPQGFSRTETIDVELSLAEVQPGWVGELERLAPHGAGNPRATVLLRGLTLETRSARMAWASHGAVRLLARGRVEAWAAEGACDAIASPGLEDGRPMLWVRAVRDAAAP